LDEKRAYLVKQGTYTQYNVEGQANLFGPGDTIQLTATAAITYGDDVELVGGVAAAAASSVKSEELEKP
jgi:hypothetical protein